MYAYDRLSIHVDDVGVCVVNINEPPCNVMTLGLYQELADATTRLATDDAVRVVVLRSADPEFFIAHFDVSLILRIPIEGEAHRADELSAFHLMAEQLRSMPKPTLAAIAGRVGGGGAELAASCDMRFGVSGATILNQMEVPLGILPGGSGTQRLPQLLGRGRALEVILGGIDVDAETLCAWGWLNRVFDTTTAMNAYVDWLAARIARFPPQAVALAKQSVANAEPAPLEGLREEAYLFQRLLRDPHAQAAMQSFLGIGGQTRAGESNIAELSERITWR